MTRAFRSPEGRPVRAFDGVVDPRLSALPAVIGRARDHAMAVGALAIATATAISDHERGTLAAQLVLHIDRFVDAVAEGARANRVAPGKSRIVEERRIVRAFAERLSNVPRNGIGLTRDDAMDLAFAVREEVVPAICRVLAVVQEDEVVEIERQLRQVREKARLVDGMFSEMGRISRMIALISINASVEAARAGGSSGRAFQVIAEEVRNLARQSTEMLQRMKAGLAEDGQASASDAVGSGRH